MLKGIPDSISPDLMHTLMSMGHGDEIVLADGNFPAASHAQRLIRADGLDLCTLLEGIMIFLPICSGDASGQQQKTRSTDLGRLPAGFVGN